MRFGPTGKKKKKKIILTFLSKSRPQELRTDWVQEETGRAGWTQPAGRVVDCHVQAERRREERPVWETFLTHQPHHRWQTTVRPLRLSSPKNYASFPKEIQPSRREGMDVFLQPLPSWCPPLSSDVRSSRKHPCQQVWRNKGYSAIESPQEKQEQSREISLCMQCFEKWGKITVPWICEFSNQSVRCSWVNSCITLSQSLYF